MNRIANAIQKSMGETPMAATNKSKTRAENMRALAWYGKKDVRMIDIPIPMVTEPKDVVLRVTGSTVCGSDLHIYHREIMALQSEDILGHEFMGIIEEVGEEVTKFKVGDRVVAAFHIACGTCEYCQRELYTACDRTNNSSLMEKMYGHKISAAFGFSHLAGGFAGGQAEYVRIPFADVNLLAIPDDVPDEKALYLSDIVCTAYHAVHECDPQKDDVVGIWGLGPIGQLVAQWLRVRGVKRIIGIDKVEERMQTALLKFGVECIDFEQVSDVSEAIQRLVPGGLDRAIDCAGFRYAKSKTHRVQRAIGLETDTPENLNEAFRALKKYGTISIIADYVGIANGFHIGTVMEKGIRMIGCGQAPVQKYMPTCLEHIRRGEFDPTVILTHRFALEDLPEVYRRFDKKDSGIIKVFVETRFSSPPTAGTPLLTQLDKKTDIKDVELA